MTYSDDLNLPEDDDEFDPDDEYYSEDEDDEYIFDDEDQLDDDRFDRWEPEGGVHEPCGICAVVMTKGLELAGHVSHCVHGIDAQVHKRHDGQPPHRVRNAAAALLAEPVRPAVDQLRAERGDRVVVMVEHDHAELVTRLLRQCRVLLVPIEMTDCARRNKWAASFLHPGF